MLEQRIQQHFIDSADLKYQAAQALSKPIAAAVQALLACVTSGGKVLACGHGASAAHAQFFAATFIGSFERERPELAALALHGGPVAALSESADTSQNLARQVRAFGQAGDVLLVLSLQGEGADVIAAVDAAHEREMSIVALGARGGGPLAAMLRETDVYIGVPHDRAARIHEVHGLVLHCICDGVDAQLFGETEI
ncbi:SIS domain-containing protein [Xylophilus sp.]|uniref:SIS domain-containing protein n=1 Tax=Xylophilus sp. TaxID=2653893 RepID=UPI0013B89C3E|nr:SIS domain-containing protein [Xylophilus sp.]KAF1048907.1 MAG: Phosphoheptose isomerase [Xylophilus sp.]